MVISHSQSPPKIKIHNAKSQITGYLIRKCFQCAVIQMIRQSSNRLLPLLGYENRHLFILNYFFNHRYFFLSLEFVRVKVAFVSWKYQRKTVLIRDKFQKPGPFTASLLSKGLFPLYLHQNDLCWFMPESDQRFRPCRARWAAVESKARSRRPARTRWRVWVCDWAMAWEITKSKSLRASDWASTCGQRSSTPIQNLIQTQCLCSTLPIPT